MDLLSELHTATERNVAAARTPTRASDHAYLATARASTRTSDHAYLATARSPAGAPDSD